MEDSPKSTVTFWTALAVVAVLCLMCWVVLPMFAGRGPNTNKLTVIANNLNQLEMAKEDWASKHKTTNGVMPTEQDLAAYFAPITGPNGLVKPVIGELYMIGSLGTGVEARLTRDYGTLQAGTVIRKGDHGLEMIPPDISMQRAGASSPLKETNGSAATTGSRR
jgi:hypothetical protein